MLLSSILSQQRREVDANKPLPLNVAVRPSVIAAAHSCIKLVISTKSLDKFMKRRVFVRAIFTLLYTLKRSTSIEALIMMLMLHLISINAVLHVMFCRQYQVHVSSPQVMIIYSTLLA